MIDNLIEDTMPVNRRNKRKQMTKKRVSKKVAQAKASPQDSACCEIQPWEVCKHKKDSYQLGWRHGNESMRLQLNVKIIELEKEIAELKEGRDKAKYFIKSRIVEHIANATGDLLRLMNQF